MYSSMTNSIRRIWRHSQDDQVAEKVSAEQKKTNEATNSKWFPNLLVWFKSKLNMATKI